MNQIKYQDFQPEITTRTRENIEWSITYTFNAPDTNSPRALFIGDSICNGYKDHVREQLGDKVNLSYWISSKCVTDPAYFRELDFILDTNPCSMVLFNNGLHSLTSSRTEWAAAYESALRFIRAKQPDACLCTILNTPLKDADKNSIVRQLNVLTEKISIDQKISVIDLFTPMDPLDREVYWSDCYHFKEDAQRMQADLLTSKVLEMLNLAGSKGHLKQESTLTGPSGALN